MEILDPVVTAVERDPHDIFVFSTQAVEAGGRPPHLFGTARRDLAQHHLA